ncbi:MAG TPA: redox-sensing transcriptional repressor Rex [Bacteroidales bacterium]|jgi:redox-sensing transcriptional repressor|nr:redox-sensing transcriptional repressor Rex [Bacteroidales bacterium]HNR41934.1 redox-sensing transcriptional repressor Rex [Bacteroidales bacterium]HPM18077.1 redox-sensing transcriptional repressor Rex [Bacteroidales bacterium]HQG76344.1 redox-sensing transcriptional repressor Rex [Bacteroidales bacterium]
MTNMKTLPAKTVERLSEYRRTLMECLKENKNYIFSHNLAARLHITAVQVRRDLMLIGYTSVLRKGYDVKVLIETISRIIDSEQGMNVAIIGIGNLGRALAAYFKGKRSKLNLIASFDNDPQKINKVISGVKCYPYHDLEKTIKELDIEVAILTVPADFAREIAEETVRYGIKGILNFTTVPLNVPSGVYLEEYDMITSIEKVAYFVKENKL